MEAGSVLSDKYRLEALLGRGGMGSVWRALHLGLNAPVAIKLMDPAIVQAPGMAARFHREAQAAAQLRSPHVVQILDHGMDGATGTPFIVMELLEGESLADRLSRVRVLTPRETSRIVSEVCRALSRAHEAGIVHRDLKPANLFLVSNDDQELTKVLDFGIAKSQPALGLDSVTRSGAILGTPLYMSPEQISGGRAVDSRSDLWSLAVVACECLTGKRPFSADSIGALTLVICTEPVPRPSSLAPVPEGFDAWFERGAARDPELRFQTARELAEALRRVCGEHDEVRWSTPPDSPGTPRRLDDARPPAAADGLPLAPTVDLKHAHTGSALAKTSAQLPVGPVRPRKAWIAAGGLGLIGIAAIVTLTREPEQSGTAPHERRPSALTRSTNGMGVAEPVVVPQAPLPLGPASPSAAPPASNARESAAPPPRATRGSPPRARHVPPSPPSAAASPAPSALPPPSAVPPPPSSTPERPTLESVIQERR